MVFEVITQKKAELDLDNAVFYYKSISENVGERFVVEYQDKLNILKTFPFFQRRYSNVQILPLKKFPYSIHFLIDDVNNIVTILALVCDHQNPEVSYIN